jgi:hypothetical protein
MEKLTEEEKHLFDIVITARKLQEFLWGEHNANWGLEEWKRMFRKRVVKIDDIDPENPHALIELKKRLLQNAALSLALLAIADKKIPAEGYEIPSNLDEYRND